MVLLPATHRWFGHLSVMTTWSWSLPACVIQVTSFALTEKTTCSWEKLIFGSHYASCCQNLNLSLKCSYVHWWVLSVSGEATAWRRAPIKQMIVLTVFSMGISLKWVSNMGYSLYLVDPYESLLHAMVKKKKWPEDRNTPKIPPGPLSASQFWLLLHEIVVSQCSCMHTRTLVKGYRSLRELSKVWVMWFFQHGQPTHFNLSYPSDYKQ